MRMPEGEPGFGAKKSPFTPTTVAFALASFSMSVSVSVPTIALFESAGASVYSAPSGRGAVTMSSTTGPCGVYST